MHPTWYYTQKDQIIPQTNWDGFENKIPAGIVLTGGTSKMEGAVALAESIFQTSVRLGIPEKFNGMESVLKNPIYATALGLIGFGFDQIKQGYTLENNKLGRLFLLGQRAILHYTTPHITIAIHLKQKQLAG